ncbi:MAG: hypothetical protein AB1449_13730 [Chloroflexota bacterium]
MARWFPFGKRSPAARGKAAEDRSLENPGDLSGVRGPGLHGKGYYIWKVPKCDGGDPQAIARRAAAAGLTHVLIKIADGTSWRYNYNDETKVDYVPPVIAALREVGVSVWGWHYVRGDEPEAEAKLAVERTLELGLDGYVIDAEGEYKKPGRREAAKVFMRQVRAGLKDLPLALSSYRFPRIHSAFPFSEFLEGCDYAMPQVYFEQAHNPEQQLERCVDQYMTLRPARPVIPTAPTYAASDWRPTANEIRRFLARARSLGLSAANAWGWDFATRSAYLDLWQAVAEFEWPAPQETSDVPEKLIAAFNRRDPQGVASLYAERAAHVTGARTVVGRSAIAEWYEAVLSQMLPNGRFALTGKSGSDNSRHFTWTASSERGAVRDGSDTLGLMQGEILYHYTFFTVS